jgi:MFS family permease
VLLFLCLLSFILYLDRICMGQATEPIQNEMGFSDTQMGVIAAAFTLAYGLFEVPTGRWGDRYGSRGVLVRIVLWWSAFTALTGAVPLAVTWAPSATLAGASTGFVMLLAVRFLFGAGEAGALPNSARVLARWFPVPERGPAQGWLTMSSLVGAVLTPIIAQTLFNQCGWKWTFAIFGAVGIVWAVPFWLWFRDDPGQHGNVNPAELAHITQGVSTTVESKHYPSIPWGLVFRSPNVWLLGFTITCSAFASYLYYSWYPKYLAAARGLSADDGKWLTAFVLTGGAVGCVCGGYLGRAVVRRTGSERWSRRALGSSGLALAAAGLAASVQCDNPVLAASWTAFASFAAMITLATWWAVVTEITGPHLGALFGLMNSMGVIGAGASQLFFGWMSDRMASMGYAGRDRYDPAFYVYSGVLLVGAVGWLFIDATRSVVEEKQVGN